MMSKRHTQLMILIAAMVLMGGALFLWWRNVTLFYPFEAAGRIASRFTNVVQSYRVLIEENKALKVQLESSSIDRAVRETLEIENTDLKKLLAWRSEKKKNALAARIMTRINDPFAALVRIDQGRREGIVKNAPVIVGDGIYLGTVAALYEETSDVMLALDPRSKVRARVVGRENTVGVLEGHGVLYRLTMVSHASVVQDGDLVVVETMGTNETLVAGIARGIEYTPDSPFQTVVVVPLFDVNTITFVGVLNRE